MASVTLGQHPAQHHLDSDQQLFHKLKSSDGKKFTRKWSLDKIIMRNRASDVDGARAEVSASLVLFNHEPPSASHSRGCSAGSPPSNMNRSIVDMDRENANNNNGIFRRHSARSRRSSVKDTAKIHASSSPQEVRNSSTRSNLSCPPDELEGLPIDKLTQARSGVVKMRSEPLRREAWSIFNQKDPRVKAEKGEGHIFISRQLSQDWCDACNRQISSAALKCRNCSYTCHLECQGLVQLDCNQLDQPTEDVSTPAPQRPAAKDPQETDVTREEEEEKPTSLTDEEIKAKIDDYNSKVTENGMKISSDGTYTGFIKVHLKLRRPVTVSVDGKSPGPCSSSDSSDNRTSFYLPRDAIKQLHISSTTTVREVIQGLLKKFMVQDNPCKFALYHQTRRDSQDLFQKLPLSECPLCLRLLAGPDLENLSFVLKENETGEVEWHAFSVPELQNFLIILEKEENERVRQVEQRYAAYREKLLQALGQVESKPG
ncbi:ras association domain-containing protein 5-like [Sinocyclocheilus anshuiensis]|uniref:ras association domain-containing protein 5-like n=1 Tax=Sinocyclocheilus anshuiensis TaxID=1608454 RepID=UPI0007B9AC78|nr:PREDICTED: ras association domain-containing protein 5-like [Sinocyclocheilus anshuiensis]